MPVVVGRAAVEMERRAVVKTERRVAVEVEVEVELELELELGARDSVGAEAEVEGGELTPLSVSYLARCCTARGFQTRWRSCRIAETLWARR